MRLNAAAAVFVAFAMMAAAIGIIASHALVPGFTRLTSDGTRATTDGATATHAPLFRGD
jgi:Na+/H+-dicarboxylate symporter